MLAIPIATLYLAIVPGFVLSQGFSSLFSAFTSRRVINGNDVKSAEKWPWQVLFEIDDGKARCGGSLIANQWILSAAHCFDSGKAITKVIMGSIRKDGNTNGAIFGTAEKVLCHKNYDTVTLDFDICLVKLDRPVVPTANLRPIALPTRETRLANGITCYVTGWGYDENWNLPDILQEATVKIIDRGDCVTWYDPRGVTVVNNTICAGNEEGGQDTCNGDSGGPLVCKDSSDKWILAGITSYGARDCGSAKSPGVYTSVSEYLEWIKNSLIPMNAKEYIGFVVDDTGSMKNEIAAVRDWIAQCTSSLGRCGDIPNGVREWLSISFNDPNIGALTGPTDDANLITQAVNGYFQPGSGGDCPEQAMKGLKKLAESIPTTNDGCKIFFFSDATPKHPEQLEAVFKILEDRGCDYEPILTGCCGPCPSYCTSTDPKNCINELTTAFGSEDAIPAFYRLAARTASPVHIIEKARTKEAMLTAFRREVSFGIARWGPWSSCSVTCGKGIETRGCYYRGKEVETSRCGDGPSKKDCSMPACPVTRKEYIGFVVDDTGSMANEIAGVWDWISACAKGTGKCGDSPKVAREWLSISFNDPSIGDLTGPTGNTTLITQAVKGYLPPSGGFDCPEQAMKGLKKLAESIPTTNNGCKIYLFTDATPKHPEQLASVLQILKDRDCDYIPVLTGCCGRCPSYCSSPDPKDCIKQLTESFGSEDDIPAFYRLAARTASPVHIFEKPGSSNEMVATLRREVSFGIARWGPWSSCSVTCGEGIATRGCYYRGKEVEKSRCGDGPTKWECSMSACPAKEYVGFVVDDTGTMPNEIAGIRKWIEACKNDLGRCGDTPNVAREWLSISFNDPGIGPLTGPTGNISEISQAVYGYLPPSGGRDCPELAMKGLKKLAESIPTNNVGCKIYLFTDATPKNPDQLAAVLRIIKDRDCEYVPILTGCCGPCPAYCSYPDPTDCINELTRSFGSEDAIPAFYRLAATTASPVHVFEKPSSSNAMVATLRREVSFGIARWGPWSSCSVTCGEGIHTRGCYYRGKEVETNRCGDGPTKWECSLPTCPAKEYVGFVVDDTGTMPNEIAGIRKWIEACKNDLGRCGDTPNVAREWLSISFNDPSIGALTGPTNNISEISQAVYGYLPPSGGRDCPELAMKGLQKLAESIPTTNVGCKIYLFTDATPKHPELLAAVLKILEDRDCEYVPILTGCCGPCTSYCSSPDPKDCITELTGSFGSEDAIPAFYRLAARTASPVHIFEKPSSSNEMVAILRREVSFGIARWGPWSSCSVTCGEGIAARGCYYRGNEVATSRCGDGPTKRECSMSACPAKEYVGFVVDDTGTMPNEIAGIRKWIEACKNDLRRCGDTPNVEREWLSISFNDPGIGALTGPTSNISEISQAVYGYLPPSGGRDCPELAMKGLKKLAESIPTTNVGCKIYLFTDATPKHPELLADVLKILEDRDCEYVPILTGCCGPCPAYCSSPDPTNCINELTGSFGSEAAIPAFYRLAARTASPVHIFESPNSSNEMVATLRREVSFGIARWGPWSSCSVTCGKGINTRGCYYRGKEVGTRRCGDGPTKWECSMSKCIG